MLLWSYVHFQFGLEHNAELIQLFDGSANGGGTHLHITGTSKERMGIFSRTKFSVSDCWNTRLKTKKVSLFALSMSLFDPNSCIVFQPKGTISFIQSNSLDPDQSKIDENSKEWSIFRDFAVHSVLKSRISTYDWNLRKRGRVNRSLLGRTRPKTPQGFTSATHDLVPGF